MVVFQFPWSAWPFLDLEIILRHLLYETVMGEAKNEKDIPMNN